MVPDTMEAGDGEETEKITSGRGGIEKQLMWIMAPSLWESRGIIQVSTFATKASTNIIFRKRFSGAWCQLASHDNVLILYFESAIAESLLMQIYETGVK